MNITQIMLRRFMRHTPTTPVRAPRITRERRTPKPIRTFAVSHPDLEPFTVRGHTRGEGRAQAKRELGLRRGHRLPVGVVLLEILPE